MSRFLGGFVVLASLIAGAGSTSRADEKDATPILDKAIAALGGQEKLTKAGTATWKSQGTLTINENESPLKGRVTIQGIDRHRNEFELEFNGNEVKGVTILDGKKGWRKFGDDTQDLDDEMLASEKQRAYLIAVASTVLPLKGKDFKVEAAPDSTVDGKPAATIKGTGPDGKSFTVAFDKETGLPLKLTATVKGFQGEDYTQDTLYRDYKDFNGVKRATKHETKRDGNPFIKQEVTEFQVIEKVDPKTFAEPN